ncbi:MAG: lumazine-binding protein [Bacteroidota bacterium]
MKNEKIKFIALLFFLLSSCHNNYSPKAVAENFLEAFNQKKFDEAKKYCTPETVKLVEIAESLAKLSSAKTDFTGKDYTVLSQEIRGETAFVKFKEKGNDEMQLLTLKYSGNQWLVSITKEDVMSKQNSDKDLNDQK